MLQDVRPQVNVDKRRKKGDKGRDKGKRAFRVTESFILEEDEALTTKQAKKDKKKKKHLERAPIPIFLPQFISVSALANQLKIPLDKFMRKLNELGFEQIGHDHGKSSVRMQLMENYLC